MVIVNTDIFAQLLCSLLPKQYGLSYEINADIVTQQ